jgi:subtilisin family serine protease
MSGEVKLPEFTVEHVISTLSQKQDWGIVQHKIPNTWTVTSGEGMTAMVIDTGWSDHSDINGNSPKEKARSFVAGEKYVLDKNGHGTHCIGIVCAKNNDKGMVGVAPDATVIGVKALDKYGSGSIDGIVKALEYAAEIKVDVVSMSLGSSSPDSRMHGAVRKLYNMNIPVICAAGNSGKRGVDWPGAYRETIAVAAYDKYGNVADFSAVGEQVDFAAPGVNIYSTWLDQKYSKLNGTSMACPFITGVVLLLLAKHAKQEAETGENDCKTVDQIKEHLKKYTIDRGVVGRDKHWGYGMIDVENLILDGKSVPVPVNPEKPKPKPSLWDKFINWFRKIFS